jgi:hypothetical protein
MVFEANEWTDEMKDAVRMAGGVALAVAGMAGLYFHVEYSGWVLLIGLVIAL